MPSLPRKEVEEIALLARLHLDEYEIRSMQENLGTILDHFSTLASVDTEGVPPMTHPMTVDLRLRADAPDASLPTSDALSDAPAREGDLFVVPAMIPTTSEDS